VPGADIAALWRGSSAGVAPQCLHPGELATFENRIILQQDKDHEPGADDRVNGRFSPKIEASELVRSVRIAAHYRRTVRLTLLADSGRWRMRDRGELFGR